MIEPKPIAGWHADTKHRLYVIHYSCHVDNWDEYFLVRDEAEFNQYLADHKIEVGRGACYRITCLVGCGHIDTFYSTL